MFSGGICDSWITSIWLSKASKPGFGSSLIEPFYFLFQQKTSSLQVKYFQKAKLTNYIRYNVHACQSWYYDFEIRAAFSNIFVWKVEKILNGRLDLIPSPLSSVKTQIMGGKVCLRCKGKTLLGIVNKLLKTKSLLTSPSNAQWSEGHF